MCARVCSVACVCVRLVVTVVLFVCLFPRACVFLLVHHVICDINRVNRVSFNPYTMQRHLICHRIFKRDLSSNHHPDPPRGQALVSGGSWWDEGCYFPNFLPVAMWLIRPEKLVAVTVFHAGGLDRA